MENKKKSLILDLDGTLIQSPRACLELYQKDKQIKIDFKEEELQWNFQPYVPKEDLKQVLSYFSDQRMYDIVEPVKDCIEVLKRLQKRYELAICTKSHRDALSFKANYIYNYFRFVDKVRYLGQDDFDKSDIGKDNSIIIDDRVECLTGENRSIRILFGNYAYNQYENLTLEEKDIANTYTILRMDNWLDIEKYLMCMN